MRAYLLRSLEAGPQLIEVPKPQVGPHEVLVRITASSVNPHDLHVISGAAKAYLEYRFPITLGNDVAGVVEAVGASVERFGPGDKVFGLVQEPVAHRGTFADYVVVPADQFLVPQPQNVTDADAGVLGLATMAAMACLEPLDVQDGETILVNGATGGVGSCVIQIAAARGARVIATAGPGREEDHVRKLGVVDVIDWTTGKVAAEVRGRNSAGIDGLVDLINHDPGTLAELATGVLRPGGRVSSTLQAAHPERLPGLQGTNVNASPRAELLAEMAAMAAEGTLRPVVSEAYDLEHIPDAHAALAAGAVGKIGIRVNS